MKRYALLLVDRKTCVVKRTIARSNKRLVDEVTTDLASRALNVSRLEVRSGWTVGPAKVRIQQEIQKTRTALGVMEWYERSVVAPTGSRYLVALFEIGN